MCKMFLLVVLLSSCSHVFGQNYNLQDSCEFKSLSFFNNFEQLRNDVKTLKLSEETYKFANAIKDIKEDMGRLVNQLKEQKNAVSECLQVTKNMETLHSQIEDLQKRIYTPVAFSVYRSSSYTNFASVITFDGVLVNLSEAMNTSVGTFTVPVTGIYYFSAASHLVTSTRGNAIYLHVNGKSAAVTGHNVHGTHITVALSQTLQLAKGDRVNLYLAAENAWDHKGNFDTQFTGFLIHKL